MKNGLELQIKACTWPEIIDVINTAGWLYVLCLLIEKPSTAYEVGKVPSMMDYALKQWFRTQPSSSTTRQAICHSNKRIS